MLGALNIRRGDTAPKTFRTQEAGVAKDLTGYTISLRVDTSPVTALSCSIVSATEGTASFVASTIPVGIFKGNFVLTHSGVSETSESFTIDCTEPI